MKTKNALYLLILISIYLIILLVFKKEIFFNKFDKSLISRYLCSQDIPYEPPCKRLFLSDSDLYLSSGYLYATGSDPTSYDFQVPPLIKYMYGYSILMFNNPYIIQIGFGIVFLCLVYWLAQKTFNNQKISLLTCFFIIVDPLFINLSSVILLDLGQAVFFLLYFILVIFYPKRFVEQGIVLGLLFTAKFWGGTIFFVLLFFSYLLYKRKFNLSRFVMHLVTAFVVFALVYIRTFINKGGNFNIIFFELKVLKFYLQHNITSVFEASLILFLTGYIKSWWGNKAIMRSNPWSIFWAIGLIISTVYAIKEVLNKKITLKFLIGSMPLLYLVYLGVQVPFPRYFILILPFTYLMLADFIVEKFIHKLKTIELY